MNPKRVSYRKCVGVYQAGMEFKVHRVPSTNIWGKRSNSLAMNFFNGEAYDADIAALRKLHPGLLTLERYLRKTGWDDLLPMPMPVNAGWGN